MAKTDVGRLHEASFTIPTKTNLQNTWDACHAAAREDELFGTLAHACAGINGQRVRRTAGVFLSWNGRSVFFIDDTPRANDEIVSMRAEHDDFVYLKSKVSEVEGPEDMIQRNPWNWIPQIQIFESLRKRASRARPPPENFIPVHTTA